MCGTLAIFMALCLCKRWEWNSGYIHGFAVFVAVNAWDSGYIHGFVFVQETGVELWLYSWLCVCASEVAELCLYSWLIGSLCHERMRGILVIFMALCLYMLEKGVKV